MSATRLTISAPISMIMQLLIISILDKKRNFNRCDVMSSSDSSKISTQIMYDILDHLKLLSKRDSMKANYYTIWKLFNKFVMKLDIIPSNWEDRIFLFLANMVNEGRKSATVRSYYSAINAVLLYHNHKVVDDFIQLTAITKA